MPQRNEKPVTAEMVEKTNDSTNNDRTAKNKPMARNQTQHFFVNLYSALITMGWHMPIMRKVAAPTMIPCMFSIAAILLN